MSRSSRPVAISPPCMVFSRSASCIADLQPLADVGGHVHAAHPHAVGVDHLPPHEDRDAGRARADVDAGGAELLLVLDQAGEPAGVGRHHDAAELEVAAPDAVQDVAQRRRGHGDEVHVDREVLADLPARVGRARCGGRARSSPAARAAPRGRGRSRGSRRRRARGRCRARRPRRARPRSRRCSRRSAAARRRSRRSRGRPAGSPSSARPGSRSGPRARIPPSPRSRRRRCRASGCWRRRSPGRRPGSAPGGPRRPRRPPRARTAAPGRRPSRCRCRAPR